MRSSETFILGAITGGIIGWVWGREIADYVGEKTRGLRTKAAWRRPARSSTALAKRRNQ